MTAFEDRVRRLIDDEIRALGVWKLALERFPDCRNHHARTAARCQIRSLSTRRGVLWLLAAGSGTTLLGNQLPEQPPRGWEMKVNIEGCPLSSANVQSFELGESVFAPPRGKSRRDVDFRAFIGVAVQSEDGAVRTFNLIDCFPTRWSTTEYSPSSTTKLETIVVKIGRVEFG